MIQNISYFLRGNMKNAILKKYVNVYAGDMCGIKVSTRQLAFGDIHISSYPLHRHDYFEIEWVIEGKIINELNGEQSIMEIGDLCGLSNVDLHRLEELELTTFNNISIDYKNAPKAIQHILGKVSFPIKCRLSENDLSEVNYYFSKLCELERQSDMRFTSDRIIAYTLLLLGKIFENAEEAKPISTNSGYWHISKAMEYISLNYSEPITLGDVAKAVSLSQSHLSQLFTKISGTSLLEYLTEHRIHKAQSALLESEKGVTEIAYECGFGSFPSFSRAFKKICGCSPSEYRKNSRA